MATAQAQSGPLASYGFEEGTGTSTADMSGNANTLDLVNGTAWATGHSGKALSFDGSNDRAGARSYKGDLNLLGGSLTLSAWIYPRSNGSWQMIVNKPARSSHSSPYFDWSLHREASTGRIVAYLGCDSVQRTSNSSVANNVWTHVAVTYDGRAIRHYINGVLDKTTTVTCSVSNTSSQPIRVGANGGGGEVMNGLIDDVRVYNRVLAANEIVADMNTAVGGTTSGGGGGGVPSGDGGSTSGLAVKVTTSPASGVAPLNGVSVTAAVTGATSGSIIYTFYCNRSDTGTNVTQPYNRQVTRTDRSSTGQGLCNYTDPGTYTPKVIVQRGSAVAEGRVAVTVTAQPNSGPAPSISLSASPSNVPSGGSSNLTWSATNATSCSASGGWSGTKATAGSASTGALTASSNTFALSCTGAGGTSNASTVVTVTASTPAPTVSLTASPTSVSTGGSSTLTWSANNANSCTASGAWSGSKATAGSASTGALSGFSNTFTLACTGSGGTTSSSATVAVTSSGGGSTAGSGLDFPGNAATGTVRFRFLNPLSIYPATYIWKVKPRQQNGYYTTFFWGNEGAFWPYAYYGAHPYPSPPPSGSTHKWEIAADGQDFVTNQDVVYNVWYTQALRVWSDSLGKHHEFYWDLPDTSRVIRDDEPSSYANNLPPTPVLSWGDAPWNESNEVMNGVIRGIQIYSTSLSVSDVLSEISSPRSTAAGSSNIWYLNINPTPSDISDKSGAGHNPSWVGSGRPQLYSGD